MSRQPTRWEQTDHRGYGQKFADLHAAGDDIEGEARLADVMAPRGATILDAGCGMGRVAAALRARGHDAYGVDLDEGLLRQAGDTYPQLPTMQSRIDDLDAKSLAAQSFPTSFDVIVCVGNVMILGEPNTEVLMLERMAALLSPSGRLLVGFHTDATPPHSREYSVEEFARDAYAAGLAIEARFGTYELHPYDPHGNYAVHLLRLRDVATPQVEWAHAR